MALSIKNVEDLSFKHPQVVYSFGGPNTFRNLLNRHKSGDEIYFRLISHPGICITVAPYNMFFSLSSDVIEEGGIANIPYQVFNTYGEVIYSVHNRNLLFGYSILDKALMVDSNTLDSYYLQYRTSQSFNHILFLINKLRLVDRDFSSFRDDLSERIVNSNVDLNNQIVFVANRNDIYIDLEDPFLNPYPIKIAFLPDISSVIPSSDQIVNSKKTDIKVFDTTLFNSFVFTPERSGWLTVYQDTKEGRIYLESLVSLGEGVDRFINSGPGVYYIALSHEMFPVEAREVLGVEDREPGTISNVIDIRVDISK